MLCTSKIALTTLLNIENSNQSKSSSLFGDDNSDEDDNPSARTKRAQTNVDIIDLKLQEMRDIIFKEQLKEKGITKPVLIECNHAFITSLMSHIKDNDFSKPINLFKAGVVLSRLHAYHNRLVAETSNDSVLEDESNNLLTQFLDTLMLIDKVVIALKSSINI